MRVEANVSLRPRGTRAVRDPGRGQEHELVPGRGAGHRPSRSSARPAALDAGETLVQETRGWSDERGETYRMRVKETSDDYRYFPEPDLPPLHLDRGLAGRGPASTAGAARGTSDALSRRARADRRTTPRSSSPIPTATALFEATLAAAPTAGAKPVANWVTGEYLRLRNARDRSGRGRAGRARARSSKRSRRDRSHAPRVARSSRRTRRPARRRPRSSAERGFHQISDAASRRRSGRRGPRREPGRGRRLPGGQGPGGRVPGRPGHEGDPRPGERRAGPGSRA